MSELARYFRIWRRMALNSLQAQLSYRMGSAGFFVGKLVRMFFFLAYVVAIFGRTQKLAGYSLDEVVVFFLTFNIIDVAAQIFLRGVYAARRVIDDGDLDTYLTQPCAPLFRMACSSVDFLDLGTLIPVLVLLARTWPRLGPVPADRVLAYGLLIANGMAIAFAIHVFVGALAVRTQELENTIWVYKDMMFLGKFPMDIYASPVRWVLVTAVPIGVMVCFPAQALLGKLSWAWGLYAVLLSAALLAASLAFWRDSLKRYTSVSR
ncbi:MAG TPA: ABC-2 family transporter protein [Elusimicrobiota bacterium]|jgi:ABC-type uncharacterized transport system permease subunit|nr:ABC-2 family transporter protein [Elusimicrobiota bacterium]